MNNSLIKIQKDLFLAVRSLSIKYEMYFTNFQYKDKFFKDKSMYESVQKKLSLEIEVEERNVERIIVSFLEKEFPDVKYIAYDSRLLCMIDGKKQIGKILIANTSEITAELISKKFKELFELEIRVEMLEILPKEIQNSILEKKGIKL